ncbi:pyridoxal phosphate-dependent aminotransferase [Draconibacterium sp. IB214405]|uniref:pyridoxal phosphate-dependent aminotransferase n=1 Tax=Draconibacterium sp. IB214405 TaxID=3097352 RepID=UPI002A0E6741|nr:pyridoxal phosphate-dependent aminotransferase [Draconibacterium sp. IB214405]MDX8339518.1 pyridoxal phosphate-dependent aminotransferase [Draconibacterium sp. IB214405]
MIAQKVKEITPFIVMEVLEKAAEMEQQGINVIHLEVGEPDFSVPQCVSQAVQTAFSEGRTHYTHSLGDPELRKQIAEKYKEEYDVAVSPDQIIVTSGSSPAILLTLGVLCEADDEIIISDPGYACYANFIRFIGAKPVSVPVFEEDGFQYRYEEIKKRITKRTKAIMINSPMNPTGNLLSLDLMRELLSFDIPIISDEIYHGLVYEKPAHSILEVTDKAFVLNGFSKRYAMTGLRLGYVIAPKEYVRIMQKVQQNLFICASSTAQRAGIEALKSAKTEVDTMRDTYNKRRKYLIERLTDLGFDIKVKPTGAFYVFVNAKHLSNDSYQLAFDILEKAHVGVTPGIDFGPNGEGFLRFSYANSIENIKEGMDRLKVYLQKYHNLSID